MDAKLYIDQFNVLGTTGEINCENLSKILYMAILNKFKVTFSEEEYYYFKEYQERVFDLIDNLRELSSTTIPIVFEYLDKNNYYLLDIIILQWCLPRTDTYLSKKIYNATYKKNIQKYNFKLIENINHYTVRNFCVDTLIKTNNVPIHCIDYLWYYMNDLTLELSFYNSECNSYIGLAILDDEDNSIEFGFNMEFLLDMGLGQIMYDNDPLAKQSFRKFLEIFVIDIDVVKKMLTIPTKNNYKKQLINISLNPSRYFGQALKTLPSSILKELEG